MKITVTGVSCNQCASSHSVTRLRKQDIHIPSLQYFGIKVCRWTADDSADGDFVLTTAHGVKFTHVEKIAHTSRAAQHVRKDSLPGKVREEKSKTERDSHPRKRLKQEQRAKTKLNDSKLCPKGP